MSRMSSIGQTNYEVPQMAVNLLKKKGYSVGKPLGSGSFSVVCKATKQNSKPIAVKIIDMKKTSEDFRKKFLPRELYMIKTLKHPNIIHIHDLYTIGDRIYVFMELADGGDILDLIKNGAVPEDKAKGLYRGVADALKYIHSKGSAHRDIKSENILLNKERTVAKIADFGFSRTTFDNKTGQRVLCSTYCGSAAYTAPEVLKLEPYNGIISDVWSMGVVLFVILNNKLPFNDKDLRQMLRQQIEKNIEFKSNLSDLSKDLIRKQLDPDIKTRYDMIQVLEHKWLQKNTNKSVTSNVSAVSTAKSVSNNPK